MSIAGSQRSNMRRLTECWYHCLKGGLWQSAFETPPPHATAPRLARAMSATTQPAVVCIEHLITGALAAMVAIAAVVGLVIITWRLPICRSVEAVLGICIIFGPPNIARGTSATLSLKQADLLSQFATFGVFLECNGQTH